MKLSRHLTTKEVYKERLEICKGCEHYFKPTGTCKKCGCFMRIKAKISIMSCAANPKKWIKTSILEEPDKVDDIIIKEVIEIWPRIKNKKADNHEVKRKLITLHNTIYNTGFSRSTNCSSCLNACYNGIEYIYKKYVENE